MVPAKRKNTAQRIYVIPYVPDAELPMAEPRHKVKPKKKKGLWHKMKNSALFILFNIVLAGWGIIALIIALSALLSANKYDKFQLIVSGVILAYFVLLFGTVWISKKIGGRFTAKPEPETESFKSKV